MVLLPEGVSPLGGVVPLLDLMSLSLRCPYGGQNVGGAVINLLLPPPNPNADGLTSPMPPPRTSAWVGYAQDGEGGAAAASPSS